MVSEKLPLPDWLFHSISPVETYILLALAEKVNSAYEVWLMIPVDSEGMFSVTDKGVRQAIARLRRKGLVKVVSDRVQSGRKERYYDLTELGAGQLGYTLRQWQWGVNLGDYRLTRWHRENDRMGE